MERILTVRELNRATLARQLLLERSLLNPLAAIKQLAGLQGQLANPPYIGLWSRLQAFQRSDLTHLLEQRAVVRTSMMRRTLHLTTAEDYLSFRPALQALHRQGLDAYFEQHYVNSISKERLLAEVQAYLQVKPRTNVELRTLLAELLPGSDETLLYRVRTHLSLVQVFPGGVWGIGGSPAYINAEVWLGRSFMPIEEALPYLIRSYLAAFGPASVKDLQTWSGLTRLQPAIEVLRAQLRVFRDEQGRELFDLPDAPLPSVDTPAPVRFMPDFDNLILAHADRQRFIADEYRSSIFPGNSRVLPTFLVDGFVRGVWQIERIPDGARLLIQPFEPLTQQIRQEVYEEGERLLQWTAERTINLSVELAPYKGETARQNLWGKL